MTSNAQLTAQLHAAYCKATGLAVRRMLNHDIAWQLFVANGYTEADLVLVIRFLKAGIARGERNAGCLRFSNLIGLNQSASERLVFFEEELAAARVKFRQPTPPPGVAARQLGDTAVLIEEPAAPPVARADFKAGLSDLHARYGRGRRQQP